MHNILLFEPNQGKLQHLVFLLKLADIQCTVARTAEEAFNWVEAFRLMINFDLILLNSLKGSELEKMLLSKLCDMATIPVVYVKRRGETPPAFLKQAVICQPDDLLSCLDECFSSGKQPAEDQNTIVEDLNLPKSGNK